MPTSCCGKFKVTGKAINRGKGGALETPMFIKMVHRSTKHKRKSNKDLTETVQENLK